MADSMEMGERNKVVEEEDANAAVDAALRNLEQRRQTEDNNLLGTSAFVSGMNPDADEDADADEDTFAFIDAASRRVEQQKNAEEIPLDTRFARLGETDRRWETDTESFRTYANRAYVRRFIQDNLIDDEKKKVMIGNSKNSRRLLDDIEIRDGEKGLREMERRFGSRNRKGKFVYSTNAKNLKAVAEFKEDLKKVIKERQEGFAGFLDKHLEKEGLSPTIELEASVRKNSIEKTKNE